MIVAPHRRRGTGHKTMKGNKEMRKQTAVICALALVSTMRIPSASAQDAKAAEILAKTRQALGGAKLDTLKSLAVEAASQRNMGQMQMAADVEILLELPDKYLRSENSRGPMSMTMNTGFNGDTAILPAGVSMAGGGTMVIRMGPGGPIGGDAPKLTDEQKAQLNKGSLRTAKVELSRLMLGWFATAHPSLAAQYTYAGEAESPDGKAHVIDVKDADGFEARLFIDQNTYLPLMVTYKGRQPHIVTAGGPMTRTIQGAGAAAQTQARQLTDDERRKLAQEAEAQVARSMSEQPMVEFSMFFDDWREVDGITFPHLMRRGSGGETNEEWTISKVKVNPKIDAKKFAVDAR
jgi:hypothetical protein